MYFQKQTGTQFALVPYRGTAPAMQDLVAGQIDLLFDTPRNSLPLIILDYEDVLDALSAVKQLAGVVVVTVDPVARSLAGRYGARIVTEAAREGHKRGADRVWRDNAGVALASLRWRLGADRGKAERHVAR